MLPRIGQFLSILALFAICGGHWAVLQTVAWAQMLRDYSAESGIVVAVQQTFSGERPCTMCRTISSEREKESQLPPSVNLFKKFEILLALGLLLLIKPLSRRSSYPPIGDFFFTTRSPAPPAPVPIPIA